MTKRLLLGAILGGLTAFIWGFVSWEALGWHKKTLHPFPDESGVVAAISTTPSGVYLLPSDPQPEKLVEKMQKGPIMLAAVRSAGFGSFPGTLAVQLGFLMLAALLLTWLLLQTAGLSYARRVLFVGVAGLAAGIIVEVPNWNWWGFSGAYAAVNVADLALTWLIAGTVIARIARPEPRS